MNCSRIMRSRNNGQNGIPVDGAFAIVSQLHTTLFTWFNLAVRVFLASVMPPRFEGKMDRPGPNTRDLHAQRALFTHSPRSAVVRPILHKDPGGKAKFAGLHIRRSWGCQARRTSGSGLTQTAVPMNC